MSEAMSYGAESCFINVNWDAWVAIGTIALAVVTVWMSLRTDRKTDARVKDRERRDAASLAVAFQHEIHRAIGFVDNVRHLATEHDAKPVDVISAIAQDRSQVLPGTLVDNVDKLGCFDELLGRKLAGAMTLCRNYHDSLRPDESYIRLAADRFLKHLVSNAASIRTTLVDTYDSLNVLTGFRPHSVMESNRLVPN
jgi:hypothetical protein